MLGRKQQGKYSKSQVKSTKIKILIFLVKLLVLSLPIFLVIELDLYHFQKFIAFILSNLFNKIGISNVLFNTMTSGLLTAPALYITESNLVLIIDPACSGIRSFYLLFALLFALSWNPKKQVKCLLTGGLILFFVNLFRIFTVTLLVIHFNLPGLFENFLWTGMLNLTVFLILYYYLNT